MKKRFLSILLTLVMVIGMLPMTSLTAHAAGVVEVDTYEELYNAVYKKETNIRLTKDISYECTEESPTWVDIILNFKTNTVLDLNGHELKFTNKNSSHTKMFSFIYVGLEGVTVTIRNGDIIQDNLLEAAKDPDSTGPIEVAAGTLITEEVNITNKKGGCTVYAHGNATVNLKGGTIETWNGYAVHAYGAVDLTLDQGVVLQTRDGNGYPDYAGGNGCGSLSMKWCTDSTSLSLKGAILKNGVTVESDVVKEEAFDTTSHTIYIDGNKVTKPLYIYVPGENFPSVPVDKYENSYWYGDDLSDTSKVGTFDKYSVNVIVCEFLEPEFKNQNPAGNDDKTTGLTGYAVGNTVDFTFDSDTPNGFTVKKSAKLSGLFDGLDADKTAANDTDSALTLTHTFKNAGLYQLTETLELYFGSVLVGKKTHVFLIEVAAKPLVTPTITQQPTSVTNATGDSVTLTAKATDANRARWYVEKSDGTVAALGDALTDGTSTQTISKASNAVGNRYFCAFWSEDNKIAKTDSVTVCFVPTVTDGSDVIVNEGTTAYLKVTASGCNHYATANGWYAPGSSSKVSSGSKYYPMGTTLCINNVMEADEGTYTYKYVTEHGDIVTGTVELVVNTGSSSTTINTFDIFGLDNPMIIGTYADTTVSVPENANYTAEVIDCTFDDADGVVTSGSGTVTIKLTPNTGYLFKPSGNISGTIDGITKAFSRYDGSSIIVVVDYNDTSSWKIVYPENDTISISTDSLTFKVGTAANGQKVEGTFECTHSGLADTNLHHTGMKYAVYSIADNAMPAGLTLNADGTITGTPTTAGVYTVMVRADSVNASGTASNCSGLAVKAIEIIVEDKDAHTHDTKVVSDTATCTTDGVMTLKCGCTVESPAKGHDWGEWNDGYPIITPPCTADSDLVITRTCANDASHTESKTISRIHMATGWTTDKDGHWKVCGYCETKILVEKDAHKDTNSDSKCDTCGYDMTPAAATEISQISLTLPENAGETLNQAAIITASGANYSVTYINHMYTTSEHICHDKDATLQHSDYVEIQIDITAAEGYEFADEVSATVNGNDANGIENDKNYNIKLSNTSRRVYYSFNVAAAPGVTDTPVINYNNETYTVSATGNGTVKLYVNGVEVTNPYTFELGAEAVTYEVTATAQEEGKEISATAKQTVIVPPAEVEPPAPEKTAAPTITYDEETLTVTATGDGTVKLYVDDVDVANPYTFEKIDAEQTYVITATAQEEGKLISETATKSVTVPAKGAVTPDPDPTYTVTVNGSYADTTGAGEYEEGETVTIHAGSRSGYTFKGWTSSDVTITDANSKTATFEMPASQVTVTATWQKNSTGGGGGGSVATYAIVVEDSENGEVSASKKYASKGTDITLTVKADEGYELDTLKVLDKNGDKVKVTKKGDKYTFEMPASKVTVEATFAKIEVEPTFDDVAEDAYYFDAVEWAVEEGITSGTSATTFSPNATCTRAQAVTFLWRAAGSPEPKSTEMPFEDVAADAYYYDAVLWAVENGITAGTSATTFSPNNDCTRAQIVTFLWRSEKSPAADSLNPFTDVAAEAYYFDAVLWAVENGVTAGTTATTFSPNNDCTRAQIVTFLYRALSK